MTFAGVQDTIALAGTGLLTTESNPHATNTKFCPFTNFCFIRNLAIINQENQQHNQFWQERHMVEIQPSRNRIQIVRVWHKLSQLFVQNQ